MNLEIRRKYAKYFQKFSCNSQKLDVDYINYKKHFTRYTYPTKEFKQELINAVKDCVNNGFYDFMIQDEEAHLKTTRFLERVSDERYSVYKPFREMGLYEEADFVNVLNEFMDVKVKSKTTDVNLLFERDTEVYYEWSYKISDIEVYIKVKFEQHYLTIVVHGEAENYD